MPNQPSIKNVQRGLRVQRPLDKKVERGFRVNPDMTVKDAYILALEYATRNVHLTEKDYKEIAEEMKAAKLERAAKFPRRPREGRAAK